MEKDNINVLIFGGLGFIGWSLAKYLLAAGKFNVNILDQKNCLFNLKDENLYVHDNEKTQELSLARNVDIEKFYVDDGMYIKDADVIFHFAEFSRVEKSLEDQEQFEKLLESNVVGTSNVILRYMNFAPNAIFFYAGSSTRFAFDEACNQSPYAFYKYSNAELVKNLHRWFELDTAVLYFYNVFGEGEHAGEMGTVIEQFRRNYYEDKPITVYGGDQTRRFTYIGDVVKNTTKLMLATLENRKMASGIPYHMISEDVPEISIKDIAKAFYDRDPDMIEYKPKRAGCRNQSISDDDIKQVNTYGFYPMSLSEYIKRIR